MHLAGGQSPKWLDMVQFLRSVPSLHASWCAIFLVAVSAGSPYNPDHVAWLPADWCLETPYMREGRAAKKATLVLANMLGLGLQHPLTAQLLCL